jgi:cbb3-type cytochrome oxidase subunit 3
MRPWLLVLLMPAAAVLVFVLWLVGCLAWELWRAKREREGE